MAPTPPWYRVAADRAVLRRATVLGVSVGTSLTVVDQALGPGPNPVLRITPVGVLGYGNDASATIRRALGVEVGDPLPRPLLDAPTFAGNVAALARANP